MSFFFFYHPAPYERISLSDDYPRKKKLKDKQKLLKKRKKEEDELMLVLSEFFKDVLGIDS